MKHTVRLINTIDFSTREGYDKASWQLEGDRHLRSAKTLRRSRQRRRGVLSRAKAEMRHHHILEMEAAVHSSTLLVGYSVETYLKAGLTALYRGCTKALFEDEVKKQYGHRLVKLADAVEFPHKSHLTSYLNRLQEVILAEGRYPYLSASPQEDRNSRNSRSFEFWSDETFKGYVELADSVRDHVMHIDQDNANPASFICFKIDDDGYFSFRCGGNLQPRITVKFSTLQKGCLKNSKDELKVLMLEHVLDPRVRGLWEEAVYREVNK